MFFLFHLSFNAIAVYFFFFLCGVCVLGVISKDTVLSHKFFFYFKNASMNLVTLVVPSRNWNARLSSMSCFGSGMANHIKLNSDLATSQHLIDNPICANTLLCFKVLPRSSYNFRILEFQFLDNNHLFASKKYSLFLKVF